jgi:hypothetical protein
VRQVVSGNVWLNEVSAGQMAYQTEVGISIDQCSRARLRQFSVQRVAPNTLLQQRGLRLSMRRLTFLERLSTAISNWKNKRLRRVRTCRYRSIPTLFEIQFVSFR